MNNKQSSIRELQQIPGVGRSIANDLWELGYTSIQDIKGQDPELMYILSNNLRKQVQDICLLYTFRCAVYFANADPKKHKPEKLKWWNWMDKKKVSSEMKDKEIRKRFEKL